MVAYGSLHPDDREVTLQLTVNQPRNGHAWTGMVSTGNRCSQCHGGAICALTLCWPSPKCVKSCNAKQKRDDSPKKLVNLQNCHLEICCVVKYTYKMVFEGIKTSKRFVSPGPSVRSSGGSVPDCSKSQVAKFYWIVLPT